MSKFYKVMEFLFFDKDGKKDGKKKIGWVVQWWYFCIIGSIPVYTAYVPNLDGEIEEIELDVKEKDIRNEIVREVTKLLKERGYELIDYWFFY